MAKRVVITGATGFIGSALSEHLITNGIEVVALTRNPIKAREILCQGVKIAKWDGITSLECIEYIEGSEAIINLAGENIGSNRWSKKKKRVILESRLNSIKAISDAIKRLGNKPGLFLQGSAVGYYGSQGNEIIDETSKGGNGFLGDVCQQVEDAGKQIEKQGIRTIIIRSGIVLGSEGFLRKISGLFRLFGGAYFGDGNNWISWIHIKDEIRAISELIENNSITGIFNLTSPNPRRAIEFYRAICSHLNKSHLLRIPGVFAYLSGKDFARDILLSSQRVIPSKLMGLKFKFDYPCLEEALENVKV